MRPQQRSRSLNDLARAAGDVLIEAPARDVAIKSLAYDSRAAATDSLFFCVPGTVSDGHAYAQDAVDSGAVAVCVERSTGVSVPEIVVEDVRVAMARVASSFFDRPGDSLILFGITGTNGKTTTVFLLESILRAAGFRTGLIGTIETRIDDRRRPGVRTTPESLDLQELLAEMRDSGVKAVAMEVTSHGLAMHRVDALRFTVAAFTNLSQDHLDFHSSMEDYFAAKRMLFTPERASKGVTNLDDPWGMRLWDEAGIGCVGFGSDEKASVVAHDVRSGPWGSEFVIAVEGAGEIKVSSRLVGHFNVSNCLAAAAIAWQAGIDLVAVQTGIEQLGSVPGRFEAVDMGQPFTVVVDYAHTPDSLDNVLRGARSLAGGNKVVCTFGCGGDRDKGKRPLMGAVAAKLADVVVVTSDNPRSEAPLAIIDSILEGLAAERPGGPDAVLADRREAIAEALSAARTGDVVVIAGKGHETGQEFSDKTIPFDDRDVARDELSKLGFNGETS
jgi:UDP-N-acetylmuramoyl-L-alanyl-D-glutamate--2,6-diaminopimelate ligase